MQLLRFKIPGFHGQPIDEFNGFKYEDNDDECAEFPPVILSYATGGKLEVGLFLNEPLKKLPMLRDPQFIINNQ